MSSATSSLAIPVHGRPVRIALLAAAVGLALLLVPTYVRLHETLWNQEAYEHGLIVTAVFWWLIWRQRELLLQATGDGRPLAGLVLTVFGLLLYFVGRSQNLPVFEVAGHIPLLAGVVMTLYGARTLAKLWFALLFLAFMVPLPGFITIAITGELKQQVSWMAEVALYHAGYPIARDGVVISVGQYRMLVADACAGLNSIYSLSAMGLLFMYLVRRPSLAHNAILLASILPIAIVANLVRVLILILLTFHFGDEAGQGFLHGASGIFLFVVALLLLIALDAFLNRFVFRDRSRKGSV